MLGPLLEVLSVAMVGGGGGEVEGRRGERGGAGERVGWREGRVEEQRGGREKM